MVNWDDLRYFLAVHRTGTLVNAAKSLKLNPTTVSRRLSALECQLSARLFDRTPKGFVLTKAGINLLLKAERMEREVLALERDVAGEDQKLEGVVKLATTEILAARFVAPNLKVFCERFPKIQLLLICTREPVNLARREADIVLRLARPREEHLVIKRLSIIKMGLYASREYLQQRGSPTVDKGDFTGHRILLFADIPAFRRENSWFEQRIVDSDANIVLRSDSVSSIYSAVAGGMGIALLPRSAADPDPQLIRIETDGDPPTREIWQMVHKDLQYSARIRAVLDFIGEVVERVKPA